MDILKPFWNKYFKFNWSFGILLILAFGIPRFLLVLQANITSNYQFIAIIFLIMWFTPIIFLTKNGRKEIGINKPTNYLWIIISFLTGGIFASLLYYLGDLFYDQTIQNWFVYISNSYKLPEQNFQETKNTYFIIFAITGMIFSPIGEELLYRGIIHHSFTDHFGVRNAAFIDSLAFSLTHLAHFGIVYFSGVWKFLFIPSILWITAMFSVSCLFHFFRRKTGSILGAIAGHAGFNLALTYFIFYFIL